jgi:hypothetical protein
MVMAAIPPLRGTLHDDAVRQAAREPVGLTGATGTPDEHVMLEFEPGSAELPWATLDPFRERVAALLAHSGGTIRINAGTGHGAKPSRDTLRAFDGLSLGLRRASAIAGLLISQGAQPARIKLLVTADDEAEGAAPGGADTAHIAFQRGR